MDFINYAPLSTSTSFFVISRMDHRIRKSEAYFWPIPNALSLLEDYYNNNGESILTLDLSILKLSAIGLSADSSYLSLANKRSFILNRIVNEYQREYRLKGMALSTIKELPNDNHPLLKVTISSAVFMMLTMLENTSITNPKMCLKILYYLKKQLMNVKPCELETSKKLPIPQIAEDSFDSVHDTLFSIVSNIQYIKNDLIRSTCLELLLIISVTRGTLNTLLSVIYLLLFKFNINTNNNNNNNNNKPTGIHKLTFQSIMKCDVDIRKDLYGNTDNNNDIDNKNNWKNIKKMKTRMKMRMSMIKIIRKSKRKRE